MRVVLASLCLVLALPAAAVSVDDGALLTSMVASAAAADARVEVLTERDLQKAMDVEAGRLIMGCDTSSSSCFAEVAAAMDASQVLHGSVGTLGDDVVLNLSLFDSARATAVGRVTAKARTIGALADRVDDSVAELLARLPATAGQRVRVLVLELDVVGATAASSSSSSSSKATSSSGPPVLTFVGAGVAALGVFGLGFAGYQEVVAADAARAITDKTVSATGLAAVAQQRDDAVRLGRIAWIAGGVLVVSGVVLAVVPLVVGE